MSLPVLPNTPARRLFLGRHGLAEAPTGPGKGADLMGVIAALGFVQVDSVNTLARAHDMILWSRRQRYRPPALGHLLHRDRQVFEHWTHDASVIPIAHFPHWRHRFERDRARLADRWRDWQGGDFLAEVDAVRDRIATRGACGSGDVGDGEARGASGGWWDWHPSKTALEYLWRTGEVAVLRRESFRKIYDLTERVIPPEHLNRHHPVEETIDWACTAALDRLGFATSGELAAFWALVSPEEARAWCAAAHSAGRIEEIAVECVDGSLRRAFAWPGTLAEALDLTAPGARVRILSPFDPVLRDRKRAARLFGFDYRIEIFVPEAQRRYGYYVFPVMEGDAMIGRIDVKRQGEVLAVTAFWPEAGVRMGKGRRDRLAAELDRAAVFAGCTRVEYAPGWLRAG
ncbi:MAG: winged helix-turn-helix domain-containing protein [Limimaricola sp.]|uniref:winged helix-turn-helix domain-containing protein n=1 Tax=Limimaricola sp. TaxID=2211665 RepID=UPI001D54CF9E|nr:crosslink repair DNA glycosylase YcaQ family protein [Limimaricola sp.]MBI1418708.1 winged helix-turn-helix domain-containing protein [Limimaricola sp.]